MHVSECKRGRGEWPAGPQRRRAFDFGTLYAFKPTKTVTMSAGSGVYLLLGTIERNN